MARWLHFLLIDFFLTSSALIYFVLIRWAISNNFDRFVFYFIGWIFFRTHHRAGVKIEPNQSRIALFFQQRCSKTTWFTVASVKMLQLNWKNWIRTIKAEIFLVKRRGDKRDNISYANWDLIKVGFKVTQELLGYT